MPTKLLSVISAIALALCACSAATVPDQNGDNSGHFTLVNLLSSAQATNLHLDGEVMILPSPGSSVGFPISTGVHHLIVSASTGTVLATTDFTVTEGAHHVAMLAATASAGVTLLEGREATDTASIPPVSGAKIRAVHLAEGQPDYEAYLYSVGSAPDSGSKFVFPFRFGLGTDARFPGYAVRPAGSYRFRVTLPGSLAAVIESDVITLGEQQVWSVILARRDNGTLQLQAVRDNMEQLR